MRSGLLFLRWAFAAIRAGVSVMPFASLAIVLPVQGKSTRISSRLPGPIGSASDMVIMGRTPVMSSAFFRNVSALPKRLSMVPEASEKIVWTRAPSSTRFLDSFKCFFIGTEGARQGHSRWGLLLKTYLITPYEFQPYAPERAEIRWFPLPPSLRRKGHISRAVPGTERL